MENRKKILIVDDDNRNIFALQALLRSRNYTCIAASNAREGIDHLHQDTSIGVVLLDMMMPDMDGYEAIPLIRQTPSIAKIPIIAVTAQAMIGDREKCLEAGADEYISKPVDFDLLVQYLQKYTKS